MIKAGKGTAVQELQLYIFVDWEGLCTEISDKRQQGFWKSLNLYK